MRPIITQGLMGCIYAMAQLGGQRGCSLPEALRTRPSTARLGGWHKVVLSFRPVFPEKSLIGKPIGEAVPLCAISPRSPRLAPSRWGGNPLSTALLLLRKFLPEEYFSGKIFGEVVATVAAPRPPPEPAAGDPALAGWWSWAERAEVPTGSPRRYLRQTRRSGAVFEPTQPTRGRRRARKKLWGSEPLEDPAGDPRGRGRRFDPR